MDIITIPASPFAFLTQDVSRQLELSREMANELGSLDQTIKDLESQRSTLAALAPIIEQLRARRNGLFHIARSLAQNASTTSSTATSVITSVTAKSSM